ncbi:unnamed protein product, partial [marine sediment metagenome]
MADYTGLVSLPEYESSAVTAFAQHIGDELQWDQFHLTHMLDARLTSLPQQLAGSSVEVLNGEALAAPCMRLPGSWDEHLQQSMSSKSRYDVRRAFRNVERAADFRLTEPSRADLDEHLDALLSVWGAHWGKGNEQATATYRHVFRRSFDDSTLWLRVVWDASEPMAVLAAFVDQGKRILYQHIMAFNRKFNKRSP